MSELATQTPESRAREAGEWDALNELRKCERDQREALQETERRAERLEEQIRERARWEVREWAESVRAAEETVVFSLATTGLEEPIDPVAAVVLSVDGETVLSERVRPGVEVENSAVRVHGHTAESLEDAPEITEFWPRLREALSGKRVVGYNAPWLRDVLADVAERYGLESLDLGGLECAMEAYSRLKGSWSVDKEHYYSVRLPGGDGTPAGNAGAVLALLEELAGGHSPEPGEPREPGGSGHDDREEEAFDNIPFMAVFPRRTVQDLL